MHAYSPTHWLILAIVMAIFGIPVAIVLKRAGYNPAWALLLIFPGAWPIGLWIFAFAKWPVLAGRDDQPASPRKPWGPV